MTTNIFLVFFDSRNLKIENFEKCLIRNCKTLRLELYDFKGASKNVSSKLLKKSRLRI